MRAITNNPRPTGMERLPTSPPPIMPTLRPNKNRLFIFDYYIEEKWHCQNRQKLLKSIK